MAIYRAISTGVASALARWETSTDGGSTWAAASALPTAADNVYPNGFTVTLDYDIVADKLINRTALGVAAGGSFPIGDAATITANIYGGTTSCVTYSGVGFKIIIGDLFGSNTTAFAAAVDNTSNGTIYIVGNATGGSQNATPAIYARSAGVIQVVGDCIGGTSSNTPGLWIGVNPGTGGNCIVSRSIASASHAGIVAQGGVTTVTTAISSSTAVALRATVNNFYDVTNAVFTSWVMISDIMSRVRLSPSGRIEVPVTGGGLGVFNSLSNQGQADPADVRSGTVYANGALEGTCAVPPAASVALNVPVDNTVGTLPTAAVVAADLLNEMNNSNLPIAQGLRDGMGASAAAIAAVGSIQAIP
jgi:hypothetical protein